MEKYSIEQIAKYNAIAVFGAFQIKYGELFTVDTVAAYYEAMLMDLKTGAMERSCIEFDRITGDAVKQAMN